MRADRTPPSRDAPGVAQAGICRTGLVFIDETAVKTKLTRWRERALVGERPCGAAPGPALGPDTGEGALLADTPFVLEPHLIFLPRTASGRPASTLAAKFSN